MQIPEMRWHQHESSCFPPKGWRKGSICPRRNYTGCGEMLLPLKCKGQGIVLIRLECWRLEMCCEYQ